jgi:hypothetical protein
MSTQITTGKVRLSYAHLFEAVAIQEGQPKKYSTAILIPKTDKATIKAINAAVEAAKEKDKGKWGGKIPAASLLKTPLRDGDEEKPDDENYAGMYFLNASSTKMPKVVDRNKQEILDPDEVYSGCYARVVLNFYGFNVQSKGVAAGLQAVQKLEDGDNLGGGSVNIDEAFGDDGDDL